MPGFGDVLGARFRHLAPEFLGARCSVPGDSGVTLKRAFKMQFRNAYFMSLEHSRGWAQNPIPLLIQKRLD